MNRFIGNSWSFQLNKRRKKVVSSNLNQDYTIDSWYGFTWIHMDSTMNMTIMRGSRFPILYLHVPIKATFFLHFFQYFQNPLPNVFGNSCLLKFSFILNIQHRNLMAFIKNYSKPCQVFQFAFQMIKSHSVRFVLFL